jgi:hypothetical protein
MDHEAEHIHQQMMETRTALTEKLETLENQVFGSVQEATSAVSATVASVKEAVQETVGSLKTSVQETVHSVKESVNIKRQVDRHPWVMLAGSVALGYVGGRIIQRAIEQAARPTFGHRHLGFGAPEGPRTMEPAAALTDDARPDGRHEGWLAQLGEQFGPELRKLKGTAIGAAVAMFRDLLTPALPPTVGQRVREVMDNMTTKLGGEPVREPVLSRAEEEFHHSAERSRP